MSAFGPTNKKLTQMCFGKQSCCSYFMRVPKINAPTNTVQVPSNSLQPCTKEALFINSLLKTCTEMRLLNTSVEVVQVCVCVCACATLASFLLSGTLDV